MARDPIPLRSALRPVAAPVDAYVRPQAIPQDNSLMQLAESLQGFDRTLGRWYEEKRERESKEDAIRGKAAFHKNNAAGYAKAVSEGLVPAYASKAFVDAYKAAEGANAGYILEAEYNAAYDQWAGKGTAGQEEFQAFLGDFVGERVKTNDPAVLAGLTPRLEALQQQAMARYVQDRHDQTVYGAKRAYGGLVDNTIDEANAAGLQSGQGTDYAALGTVLVQQYETITSQGMSQKDAEAAIVEGVVAKAIELRDPDLLKILDTKVPGTDLSWGDTPFGSKRKAETINTLEVMARRSIEEERKAQEAANKAGKARTTAAAIELLISGETIPEELMAEGVKYDPEFRTDMIRNQALIRSNTAVTDPEVHKAVMEAIMEGGGVAAIRAGIGSLSAEDIKSAYAFVKSVEENQGSVKQVLQSQGVKNIRDVIRSKTIAKLDLTDPFAPGGMDDRGLAADYDFRRAVTEWTLRNPGAGLLEQEEAIAKIGDSILKRLERTDMVGESTYNREGLPDNNPFQPQPQAEEPPEPPAPTEGPGPTTTEAEREGAQPATPEGSSGLWGYAEGFANMFSDPEWRAKNREAIGRALGYVPDAASEQPVEGAQGQDDIEGGAAGDTLDDAPDPQPSPEAIQQVADALTAAINANSTPKKDYTLAVINDDPQVARILDFVAGPESRGNYNAVYSQADRNVDLGTETLDTIIASGGYRTRTYGSSAIGRYQFMKATLQDLKKSMGLSGGEKFTPELQDRMAIALLERRGLTKWRAGEMTLEEFANNLAKEWASLPNMQTGRSHYAGDGMNKSLVTPDDVRKALS